MLSLCYFYFYVISNLYVIYRAAEKTGYEYKKIIAFPKGNKLFGSDFFANLNETSADIVQFTTRWNWKWIV